MTYIIGQQICYGLKPGAENHKHKAEVIGVTHLESGMHYVLRSNETAAFIRPEEHISPNITLAEYIVDYINEARSQCYRFSPDVGPNTRKWIAEAVTNWEARK